MANFRLLKILDLFQAVFRRFDIDYNAMRKMLEVKLMMDQRREPTIFQQSGKKEGNQFLKSLGIYALYGLVLIPFLFLGENYIFMMSIIFGIAMFILMTSMISDFSSVLLDIRDKNILNTKPVNARTVSAAKIVHVGMYMAMLTIAFVGVPSLVMLSRHGVVFFLLFLVTLMLFVFFIIALTALVYIFILRFFSGEQLKDMINYVQILLTVGIFVGYQVLIRSFDFVDFDYVYDFSLWHVFVPPMWFGAPFEWLLHGSTSPALVALTMLALIVPLLSIYLYYRLMPAFERSLEKLEGAGKSRKRRFMIENPLARFTCFRREERVFFRFAWQMMKRERDFKLKVYPSLGIAIVFPFIFIYNQLHERTFEEVAAGKSYLTIYLSSMMIAFIVQMLKYSASYKGSWLLQAAPVQNPRIFYSAALKAALIKLYAPVFLLLAVLYSCFFSFRVIPDLAVVLVSTCLLTLFSYRVMNERSAYPFSEAFQAAQNANTMKNFMMMFLIGLLTLVHYVATLIPYGILIYLILLLLGTVIGWKVTFGPKLAASTPKT